jgi:four helix bundle protein
MTRVSYCVFREKGSELKTMNYAEWVNTVPEEIRNDPLWNQEAYRLALFPADIGWQDTTKLSRDGRTLKLAAQLFDALGSIGANISEGYSRRHNKDRARFYEYALGSARETRTWYFDARHLLDPAVTEHRIRLLTQIIRLLLTMLPATRGYSLHEGNSPSALVLRDDFKRLVPDSGLSSLLENILLPEP